MSIIANHMNMHFHRKMKIRRRVRCDEFYTRVSRSDRINFKLIVTWIQRTCHVGYKILRSFILQSISDLNKHLIHYR